MIILVIVAIAALACGILFGIVIMGKVADEAMAHGSRDSDSSQHFERALVVTES